MKLGITGVSGRMGGALLDAVDLEEQAQLSYATARAGTAIVGKELSTGIRVRDHLCPSSLASQIDALIDFTSPEATLEHLQVCANQGVPVVVGTTGLNKSQWAELTDRASHIPVCYAANYSVGVNLVLGLLEQASAVLGDSVDVEIIEAHHRFKKDAPSGTALAMGQAVAKQLGRDLDEVAVYGREGISSARERQTIGFSTVRGGDVVGEHQVLFMADGERVEIGHKASSRLAFATGAVRAAKWLVQRATPGLYDMRDVLGFSD